MKIFGSSLLIIIIPFLIVFFCLIVYFLFRLKKFWAAWRDARIRLTEERRKVFEQVMRERRPLSKEESRAFKEKSHGIIEKYKRKARIAANDEAREMGLDDLKTGNRELMNELKTKDIKGIFSIKDLFKK